MISNIFLSEEGHMTWMSYAEIGVVVGLAACFAKLICSKFGSAKTQGGCRENNSSMVFDTQKVVPAFQTSIAIPKLVECLKAGGFRLAVFRKNEALQKIIEITDANGRSDLSTEIAKVKASGAALFTPLDADMKEEWEKVIVVRADNPRLDDMKDAFILADTGRCKAL